MLEITDRVRYTKAHAKTSVLPKEALLVRGTVVDSVTRSTPTEVVTLIVLWDDGTRSAVREDNLRGT